jgi:hypothetical protein
MVGAWYLLPDDDDSGDGNPAGRTVSTEKPAERKPAPPEEPEPTLPPMECPAELTNCEVASGTVIYVEAVDPDGDGDAHFVTLSNQSITSTAITVFDVKPELRPNPLPGRGDLVGGFGPVYEGSFGQRQIEVIEFHVGK